MKNSAATNVVSKMAGDLIGSEVLKIAGEISALVAGGRKIINFTVGDFDPRYFPIPTKLKSGIAEALEAGQTNYPPSTGLMPLREAVAHFYTREFGYETKPSEVLIAGGARPLIYATYATLLDPGDKVLYPVPSWNNNHYCHLSRTQGIPIHCKVENGFLPTAREIEPYIREARLLCLNSPLNPTGTAFTKNQLSDICALVVSENDRRKRSDQKPLFLMFDQIYWKLTFGATEHFNPVNLVPAIRPFTIFVDGLSKYFCATGLRVGWAILPETLLSSFSNILGHIGAWAPKPEQVAVGHFLRNEGAVQEYISDVRSRASDRLQSLYQGIMSLREKGLGIDAIKPQGGIYLSVKLSLTSSLASNEQMRKALLQEAGLAMVPFQAFGLFEESGWMRFSIGAVGTEEIPLAIAALETFLSKK